MRFDILTLFPHMTESVLSESIIGRAREKGIIEINCIDIRDFTANKHRKVDDTPYSGGGGMIMQAQPIYDAYMSIVSGLETKPLTVYMSPQGKVFDQRAAEELSREKHIVLLCGHYEGVDQRVLDEIVDMELSIGDFVLTGGEIPAMAVIDAVSRLLPGVLASAQAYENESHYSGLLEYPQYTRPPLWNGREIPEILVSGHHANIEKWKREQALVTTLQKRPDMLERAELSTTDMEFLENLKNLKKDIEK